VTGIIEKAMRSNGADSRKELTILCLHSKLLVHRRHREEEEKHKVNNKENKEELLLERQLSLIVFQE